MRAQLNAFAATSPTLHPISATSSAPTHFVLRRLLQAPVIVGANMLAPSLSLFFRPLPLVLLVLHILQKPNPQLSCPMPQSPSSRHSVTPPFRCKRNILRHNFPLFCLLVFCVCKSRFLYSNLKWGYCEIKFHKTYNFCKN